MLPEIIIRKWGALTHLLATVSLPACATWYLLMWLSISRSARESENVYPMLSLALFIVMDFFECLPLVAGGEGLFAGEDVPL